MIRKTFHSNLSRLIRIAATMCFVFLTPTRVYSQLQHEAPVDDKKGDAVDSEIKQHLDALNSNSFVERQNATNQLAKMGSKVVEPIRRRIQYSDVEFQNRSLTILFRIAMIEEFDTSKQAIDAIRDLTHSNSRAVAARAKSSLARLRPRIEARVIQILKEKKIEVYANPYADPNRSSPVAGVAFGKDWKYNKEDFDELLHFPNLYAITLDHPKIDDEDIAKIAALPRMQRIAIRHSEISVKSFKRFAEMQYLNRLECYYCDISDEVIESLQACKQLAVLKLIGTGVTDDGISQLNKNDGSIVLDYRKGGYLGVRYNRGSATCLLTGIEPSTAAANAGMQVGDTIIKFNGQPIKAPEDLSKHISPALIEDKATVTILRAGKEVKLKVALGKWHIPRLSDFINSSR